MDSMSTRTSEYRKRSFRRQNRAMNSLTTLVLITSLLQFSHATDSVYHRFKLGEANGTIVSDGPALFLENPFLVPTELVAASYNASGRHLDPISLQQNILFIDLPKVGRVMVDAGSRRDEQSETSPESGALFVNMKAAGISRESVDVILLTHVHMDHVSGIRAIGGGRAFPNAKVYINRREHMFWTNPPLAPNATDSGLKPIEYFSRNYQSAIEAYKDRLYLVRRGNYNPLPGIRFIFGPGHTPGHCAIQIRSGMKRLIVSGDTWVSKEDQLQHPEWRFRYETNHKAARRSRVKLLRLAAKRGYLVLAYHEEFPGLGYIKQERRNINRSFDWIPAQI